MQRAKRSKDQNVIEVHSRLGHLKNISHPAYFLKKVHLVFPFTCTLVDVEIYEYFVDLFFGGLSEALKCHFSYMVGVMTQQ